MFVKDNNSWISLGKYQIHFGQVRDHSYSFGYYGFMQHGSDTHTESYRYYGLCWSGYNLGMGVYFQRPDNNANEEQYNG